MGEQIFDFVRPQYIRTYADISNPGLSPKNAMLAMLLLSIYPPVSPIIKT